MIWHKRKRKIPTYYLLLISAAWIALWWVSTPPASTGCMREEIISFMDGILEPQDYNPAFVPPPRRPKI